MAKRVYLTGFKTDKGQQRSNNEDAGEVLNLPGVDAAFVVCDGMGGMRAGEVASGESVRIIGETLREFFSSGSPDPVKALGEAFRRANDHVNALNARDRATMGKMNAGDGPRHAADPDTQAVMGTTCVAGVVTGETLHLAHAGDSRAYLLRGGSLERLTEDHSFVAQQVKEGNITEAEARTSRFRNMITRAIGIDQDVDPEFREIVLQPGDTLLVCSDGLTTMLTDAEIATAMNANGFRRATPERAAQLLVDAANRKGGEDNITVFLLRADAEGGAKETTPMAVDIDAPRPENRVSPWVWMLLGALLLLAVLAVLSLFKPVKDRAIAFLSGGPESPTRKAVQAARLDYGKLVYDEPVLLNDFLARGDLLAYSPGVGLYFVAQATGKVALITPTGQVPRSVETLDAVPTAEDNPPATRVFMTSDPQGNVYLSYTKRRVVEKKGPNGELLYTFKGFQRPEAVAVDDMGNVYVVDFNQIRICRARKPGQKSSVTTAIVTPTPSATPAPATARPSSPATKPTGR